MLSLVLSLAALNGLEDLRTLPARARDDFYHDACAQVKEPLWIHRPTWLTEQLVYVIPIEGIHCYGPSDRDEEGHRRFTSIWKDGAQVLWIEATFTRDVGPVYTYVLGDSASQARILYRRVRVYSPPGHPCYICLLTPEDDCDCPPPEIQIEDGIGRTILEDQRHFSVIDANGRRILEF
jgi:hypothetical protein